MVLSTEFYKHLHAIESHYGSISNVPRTDYDFLEIHKIIEGDTVKREIDAVKMLLTGEQEYVISADVGLTYGKVEDIRRKHHLPLVKPFDYTVDNIYFQTLMDIANYYERTTYKLFYKLKQEGHVIVAKTSLWCDIPINARYFTKRHIYIKKNADIRSFRS